MTVVTWVTALRAADIDDHAAVIALLERCGLPTADVEPASLANFIVVEEGGQLVGTIGLERRGDDGLLRSLAVDPYWRGRGIATALVDAIEQLARASGLHSLWLLTTTAPEYFSARGFKPAARESAPQQIRDSSEFSTLCPAKAACFSKTLTRP
jgi:amino-acid N-acetyltransferase